MESGNGGASSKGVLVPVSERTGIFQSSILTTLKTAYLYEESKQSFRYTSAVLVKNPALELKYNAFREKKREVGYSEEELKESYGFLLFDDIHKANAVVQTGVLTGNSSCTTLGDPSKGVYISMYSDCLDLNCWYHEKSGYIAIIRLTKGRVKKVLENYTQNFNEPTVGFDCHVSEQLPSVSSETSSFLAFERTQYYVYELIDDSHNVTTQSPSAAFPIAIVSFSYTDTKATLEAPLKKCEEKQLVYQYFPWRGQLEIGTQVYDVGLRSTAGALIPAVLSPVVKIDQAISMFNLRQLLPRAVFETCFSGEVCLDGLYFSQCEFVSTEVEESNSLSLLLREIKEKDLALIIQLNDGGFLILLHSSHFLPYDDIGSSGTDVLQGMFVFPNTRVIHTDANFQERKLATSSEILQVLPVLSYAEGKVEKTPIDPSEELCQVVAQHMQTYAALINPGLATSPSQEISIFPNQYDVPAALKHLYSSPEWTNKAWESFGSYLRKPDSFQLQVSKATEILMSGQEERMEDLDDDVYIYLSSPEGPQTQPDGIESEEQLEAPRSPVNVETPVDSCIPSSESKIDSTTLPQKVLLDDVKAGDSTRDTGTSDLSVLIKTDDSKIKNLLTPSTSDDLPAELIVSLTSAENAVTGEGLTMISNVSAAKHNDFQLSVFSTVKLQTEGMNSLNESFTPKQVLDCPQVTNLTKTKPRKLHRGHYKSLKKLSKACFETPGSQMQAADDNLKSQKESTLSSSKIDRRKVQMRKCKSSQLSSKNKRLRAASIGIAAPDEKNPRLQSLESTILNDFEDFPLRKKTERSDLKPVISECGRILVPHGSVDFADQIKSLTVKLQSRKDEQCPENVLVETSTNAPDSMAQESSATPDLEVTTSKDGGNQLQHVVRDITPECRILRQSDDANGSLMLNSESGEFYLKTDVTATSPSGTVKGKYNGTLSQGNLPKNSEFLFSKLKSVLERKRKTDPPSSEETTADTAPCLKKVKVDLDAEILKRNYAISCVQDTRLCVNEVSRMSSVDPIFAFALGLTPKWTVDKLQKSETQQKETISEKPPEILNRPSPIFPRRGRIKTLKRHQGISTECVKKKWWLHFQTPACYASEKPKFKDSGRANSVRKTVKKNINSACSSTDALSLLADLALRADNDQVPLQPNPALERETETSLKKCDLSKDLNCAEQESILPSLLAQPAAKTMQPLESTSPNHLVESSEWVGLVSKEHAYSSPPSSSLLLGLPGTPFQVSPLSGSSRLLRHHQTMYGKGIKALHPSVSHERSSEENQRTPDFLKKNIVRRRKFRHSRSFENKDGSIQVTKQWEETYDFNLDSKFTNDSKDRTIVRALHGPWDVSLQDTSEEVLLIVHMWIGLFYSRSTERFFHVDSYQHSEERDHLEMSREMVSASSFAPFSSIPDLVDTTALEKDSSALDPGSAILDLSQRNSNAEKVGPNPRAYRKETSVPVDQKEASEMLNTLKSSVEPQESIKIQQSKKMVLSTEINEVNDVRSLKENLRTCTQLQKALSLEHSNVSSWKGDGTIVPVREEMEKVYIQPENNQKASGFSNVLHGHNNKQTDMKDGIENSEATEMNLVQIHEKDLSKTVNNKAVGSNKELSDVLQTVKHYDTQSKDGEKWEENPYQEGNVESRVICTNEDPTNEEFSVVCDGNVLDNKKHSPTEEPKASSPGKPVNEDLECCAVQESKEMEDEDPIGEEDGFDDRDSCVPPVETDNNFSNQPVPMICDGPDSLQTDSITESNPKPPMDETLPQPVNKEDACHDLQLRKLCANGCGLPVEHDISEKCSHTLSEIDHSSESAFEKSYKDDQKTPLPMSEDNKDTDLPISQTKDSVKTGSHNNKMGSFNWSRHDHDGWDRKSIEGGKELDDNIEKEPLPNRTHSPLCETKVKLTDEKDLKQIDNTNEAMAKINSEIVIPLIKIDTFGKHTSVVSWKGDCTIVSVQEEMEKVYFQPESNQKALGVSDVLHGCNNNRTDTKDGIENSEATEMSLIQTHGRDSSQTVADKKVDSTRELSDVFQTVQHEDTQPKDEEKWESKDNLSKEGSVESSPKVMCTNDDSTNTEFGIVCVGNVSNNKKHSNTEAPKASSPGKPVNEDLECCTVQESKEMEDEDPIGEEDGLDDRDSCVPPVETDNNFSNQPVPMICDGPDSLQRDCITESNPKPPLVEQPPEAVNKEDACHDLQLRKLCANGCGLPVEHDISEKCSHTLSEIDHSSESAFEKSYKDDQKTPLPMSEDNKDTDLPISQTKDSVKTGSHNNKMGSFNWSRHDHDGWDRKSIEGGKELDDNIEKEPLPNRTHSPLCETKVKLTDEKDLKQIDNTNEAMAKINSEIVIPLIKIDTFGKHTSVVSWKGDCTIVSVQEEMEKVYFQPESNQKALGVSDVLHGCNNNRTDTKDGIENSEATEMSLIQTHGRDSSQTVADKKVDSTRELSDVFQTVQHEDTQPKDEEKWESKDNLSKEGSVESSPKVMCTNDDSTNTEFGIVCVGNVSNNKKHSNTEAPKASSPGKPVNEDLECCTVQESKEMEDEDPIGEEDGLDDRDSCVPPVETDNNFSNQPVPMICDGPDSLQRDCITESNPKPPLVEQPPEAVNKEDACHDLQLRKLCANGCGLPVEHDISEKCSHTSLEIDHSSESAFDKSYKDDQKTPLPMSDDNKDTDMPIAQINDCVENGSHNNKMGNCNWSRHDLDDWDKKSIEGGKEVDNTIKKEPFPNQTYSPLCETKVKLTDEKDLKQINTNEALAKINSEIVIPSIGVDTSGEHTSVASGRGDCTIVSVQEEMEKVYVQPASNQKTLGVSDVLHGCNNKQTDTKDGIENSETTEMTLVQTYGRDSSKTVPDKAVGSNKESSDVLQTVEHDDTQSKDGEKWESKEKPYQEGNVELSSTNGDSTNEEFSIVCVGNVLHNKHSATEEPKASSPGKPVNEDLECCTVQESKEMENEDPIGEEDGLDDRDSCVPPVETDNNFSNQPVPMICDGPDSLQTDCIKESNPKPPMDETLPQPVNKEDACHDLQLRKLCANGCGLPVEHDISEKCSHPSSEVDHSSESAFDKSYKDDQKTPLPMSDDNKDTDMPIAQTKDSVKTESHSNNIGNFNWSRHDLDDWDRKSIEGGKVDNIIEKEQTHSPLCETKVKLTDEKDLKQINNTNEAQEKIHSKIVIPFIGIDTSGEDSVRFHDPHSQGKVEDVVQAKEEIPFIGETGVCGTSQKDTRQAQWSVGELSLSLNDVSNTIHLGGGSISPCSTPTMDEKPFDYITRSGPSNTSTAFSASETKSKLLSGGATATKNEMPHKSTVNSLAGPHQNIHPDLELRTLRVLQSIDKLLHKSSETSSPEKANKRTLHQAANTRSKHATTCVASSNTSYGFKDEKISNTAPAGVSASSSRELNTESTSHVLISPLIKLEELLGVKLQLKKTASSVPHPYSEKIHETTPEQVSCQPYRSVPSPESLPASIVNQETHKTTSQTNVSHEPRLCSQRPVMAVKPSKSDESQGDNISKDRQIENAVVSYFSKDQQNTNPKVPYTVPTTLLLVKSAERLNTSEGVNDVKPDACELSSKSSWLTNFSVSSSLPVWSSRSAKGSSSLDGGSVKDVGQRTENSIEIKPRDSSAASTSHADNNLLLGPQSSLICTVNNTTPNKSYGLLEQVSQRCVQNDPTKASMEQECLIFSETMKQLMKRSKREPVTQRDTHDKRNFTCASPLTVHFHCLDVQGDSMDNPNTPLNATSLVGQKIKVEMPERKHLVHSKEEENTLHVHNISQGAGNLMEHPGISGVTSECSRLYKAMMNDVCAVRKLSSRPMHFRMDRGYPTTEPGNHFDFCDQMKKELDKSFRSNLNSVVKKSCKTKYRFYILVTSDVAFFQETKAQLEAEGHTAVQPSQFFNCEDSSSSLLIIIRNEDIAEHILKVPHLLRLKTSPAVQFAGIDEPDDVVNLTYQELFKRGGFVMFDSAALELLDLCNMKKMSEILQELSRMGKWKWMMHYRDSRWLKENARLSKEANEKKLFLNVCQEGGLLEVLPYHECDLMSRDLPDYRTCLVRLQVQNISSRYSVFITDKTTDSAFGENGILTMTFQSFLTYSQSKTFTG